MAIAELARWLGSTGVTTRTGKARWDRSTIWGMLRNPAYAGRACFGKTGRTRPAGRPQPGRPAGRARDRRRLHHRGPAPRRLARDRRPGPGRRGHLRAGGAPPGRQQEVRLPRQQEPRPCSRAWPPARAADTPATAATPRTSAGNKIFYYRCIGSDNYRFEHGKVCDSKPVRADYLDQVVWDHITHLIADPALIRAEIDTRLAQIRTADPATAQRKRLDDALAKTTGAITRLIGAYQEDLISLDELRARMPDLRARQTSLRHQAQALDAQLADREVYLKLAEQPRRLPGHPPQQRRPPQPSKTASASCACSSRKSWSAQARS